MAGITTIRRDISEADGVEIDDKTLSAYLASLDLRRRIMAKGGHPPKSLAIIVGLSSAAYRRPDGVYVLPITALKP